MAIKAILFVSLVVAGQSLGADAPTAGKTGVFTVSFTERSPLTAQKELIARLGQKKFEGEYDLSKQECIVVVPDAYDPAKPMGLVVLLNYKGSNDPPTPALPVFADHNLALVIPKDDGQPWWAKCALAVDIVHNMQQLYKIDPQRIYLFAFDLEWAGLRAAIAWSDVFTGEFVQGLMAYWKPLRSKNGGRYNGELPPPPARQLGLAKAHPLVLCWTNEGEYQSLLMKAFPADGFKSVKTLHVTVEDIHYPNYTSGWVEETLKFLDNNQPKPKRPATKPAS